MVRQPTPTEAFVHSVCRQSFLSLWSYASPQGRTYGRELCDILVVCDPDVIIFSVKEVRPNPDAPDSLRFQRWVREAVEKSVDQIYGAERFIRTDKHQRVVKEDGSLGVLYPEASTRRIHRVAVALGGDDHFPVRYGDFGKGFVHVFDGRSFLIALSELDTITDFVDYLRAKETLFSGDRRIRVGLEEDLLAIYLHENRTFPNADVVDIEPGCWNEFVNRAEVIAKKERDRGSYAWDKLIELISRDVISGELEYASDPDGTDVALRTMARESRFHRRMLGSAFTDFMNVCAMGEARSRMTSSPSNVGYVFLASPRTHDRQLRNGELRLRCFVARDHLSDCATIIGIGTEEPGAKGASWDLVYLHIPVWTEEDAERAKSIKRDLGYFLSPRETHIHNDEYPSSG